MNNMNNANNISTDNITDTRISRKRRKKKRPVPLYLRITTTLCILVAVSAVLSVFILRRHYRMESEKLRLEAESREHEAEEEAIHSFRQLFSTVDEKDTYSKLEVAQLMETAREEFMADGREEVLSSIRGTLEETNSSIDAFRRVFKNDVVITNNNKYLFIPIDKELAEEAHPVEFFTKNEDGTVSYTDDNGYSPVYGIDVSSHQSEINWEKVAESGVEFAIIRIGYRGYSKGDVIDDAFFEKNIQGAIENNIHTGIYFFTQAVTEEEMHEEVEYIKEHIAPYYDGGPIVIDVEEVESEGGGRTVNLSVEQRTNLIRYFCQEVEKAGMHPMIYGNLRSTMLMYDFKALSGYDLWYAHYSYPIYFPYKYSILQYSSTGKVPGITGHVDLNLCFEPWWE